MIMRTGRHRSAAPRAASAVRKSILRFLHDVLLWIFSRYATNNKFS